MHIRWIVSEEANRFHAFSCLTEWHFSARRALNDYLLGKYGLLSPEQREAISLFKDILGKGASGRNFVGYPFFQSGFAFSYQEFASIMSRAQFDKMVTIFRVLDPWWSSVWRGERRRLDVWKNTLSREEVSSQATSILRDIGVLFGNRDVSDITAFLLLSAPANAGGGANFGGNTITLECGGLPITSSVRALGIFWHEVSHIMANRFVATTLKSYLRRTNIQRVLRHSSLARLSGFKSGNYFREAIAYSLFPYGYLGLEYFGVGDRVERAYDAMFVRGVSKAPLSWRWGVLVGKELAPIVGKYIREGRRLDVAFLGLVEDLLRRFIQFVDDHQSQFV